MPGHAVVDSTRSADTEGEHAVAESKMHDELWDQFHGDAAWRHRLMDLGHDPLKLG